MNKLEAQWGGRETRRWAGGCPTDFDLISHVVVLKRIPLHLQIDCNCFDPPSPSSSSLLVRLAMHRIVGVEYLLSSGAVDSRERSTSRAITRYINRIT